MAKTKRFFIPLGALLALALSPVSVALESLSAPALLEACRAYQRDSKTAEAYICRGYILGYLSASADIVAEEDRAEGFVARATRTRGMRLSDETQRRLSSRYCLPQGETLADLVARMTGDPRPFAGDAGAALVMRRLFESHYQCDAETRS